MKKVLLFVLAAAMFVACDNNNDPTGGKIKSATLPTAISIIEGQTQRLTLTVNPENAVYEAIWESSNDTIVKVNEKGEIWAVALGEATITATIKDTDIKATCKVTVQDYISSIAFDKVALWNIDEANIFKAMVKRSYEDSVTGEVKDTIREMECLPVLMGIISNTMYFDAEGMMTGDDGMKIDFPTVFAIDRNNTPDIPSDDIWYCLGDYEFVPADSLRDKNGNIKNHTASAGVFDQKLYTMFWTAILSAKTEADMPDPAEYPYFTEESSVIVNTFADEQGMQALEGGYVVDGIIELDEHPTDPALFALPYYNINAKVFTNRMQAGLATGIFTDPDTGEEFEGFADADQDGIVDMAPIVDHNFNGGTPTTDKAPRAMKATTVRKMYSISKLTHLVEHMHHSNLTFNR